MFLRIEGQFDHTLEHLVGVVAGEVAQDQLLGVEPEDVAQQARPLVLGVAEAAVAVVDDDQVVLGVVAGAPQLAGRVAIGVAGDAATAALWRSLPRSRDYSSSGSFTKSARIRLNFSASE